MEMQNKIRVLIAKYPWLPWAVVALVALLVLIWAVSGSQPLSATKPPKQTDIAITPEITRAKIINTVLDRVKAHYADNYNVAQENIIVVSQKKVQWQDKSLGCPKKGGTYELVTTPGYIIELSNGKKITQYHTDEENHYVVCNP